jgi:hypothetical protein
MRDRRNETGHRVIARPEDGCVLEEPFAWLRCMDEKDKATERRQMWQEYYPLRICLSACRGI